jgi:hypothetical protein
MSAKHHRIILIYKGKTYKLMSFFVNKDNSFYFNIYHKPGQLLMIPNNSISLNPNFLTINPNIFKHTSFEENHISFHESGKIHLKGKNNSQIKVANGIPFSTINNNLQILVIVPKNPINLLECDKPDPDRDLQINLPINIQPFTLNFWLHNKKSNTFPPAPKVNLLGGVIGGRFNNNDFELFLYMTPVYQKQGGNRVEWPSFTLRFFRTA